jgi:uncharacterized GH25 family protein
MQMKSKLRLLPPVAAVLVGNLFGHDMWIEPSTFFVASGQAIALRLLVGQQLLGDPIPRSSRAFHEFIVEDQVSLRRPVIGREGFDPAGVLRIENPGIQVVGYFSKPSFVEIPAEKFNEYLKEEGLDQIAALRAKRKQLQMDVKEQFSRCAKSLVSAAGSTGPAGGGDRALGFPLELIAGKSPYGMVAGDALPVQLLHEKKPIAGVLVVAMNRMHPAETVKVRTDQNGRATLKLTSTGMWMIKAVHMLELPQGSEAQYHSLWASLTFDIRAKSPSAAIVSKK